MVVVPEVLIVIGAHEIGNHQVDIFISGIGLLEVFLEGHVIKL